MNQAIKIKWSWIALAGIALIAVIPYLFGLNNRAILEDEAVAWGHPAVNSALEHSADHSVWNSPYVWNDAGSSWRPLATWTFSWNYALWGTQRTGYYIVQVILRMIIAGLFFFLLIRLFKGVLGAFLWGVVVACHPGVSQAVFSLSGRSELLGLLFFLSALLAYMGKRDDSKQSMILAPILWLSYLFALLSHEATWVLLPLLLVFEWLRTQKEGRPFEKGSLVRLGPLAGILLIWVMIRGAMGPVEEAAEVSGILAWMGPGQKGLASLAVPWLYLRLLFFPFSLSTNYVHLLDASGNMGTLNVIFGSLVWVILAGLIIWSLKKKWVSAGLGLLWFTLGLLATLPLLRGHGALVSESYLLFPAGGLVIALIAGVRKWTATRTPNIVEILVLVVIAATFGVRTGGRAADLKSDGQRLHTLLQTHPDNASALFERGNHVLTTGRWTDARDLYMKTTDELSIDPRFWINLGIALQAEEDYSRAVRSYILAGRILSEHQGNTELAFKLHYHLGLAYSQQGRNELSSESLEKALVLKPNNVRVLVNLGSVYAQERETFERARTLLLKACRIQNDPKKNEQLMDTVRQIDDILSGRVFQNDTGEEMSPSEESWE